MTISEKLEIARDLFKAWNDDLCSDVKVRGLLELLHENLAASGRVSRDLGIVAACKHCEEDEGGSCCGAGIENRYSPHLLLVNLLLGASLPEERCFADSCYFLGKEGCVLKARDILCINYLCTRINRLLAHEDLLTLQAVTGKEMETVFLLHEAVKQFIMGLQGIAALYRKA
jgi:hypothetical protein